MAEGRASTPGLRISRGAHAGAGGCARGGAMRQESRRHVRARPLQFQCGRLLRRREIGVDLGVLSGARRAPISASARSPTITASRPGGSRCRSMLVWAAPGQVILISSLGARRAADRGRHRGRPERDPAVSHGGGAAAAVARPGHAAARPAAAGPLHVGEHVGGIAAPAAGNAARAAHRLLQRPVGRLHGHGGDVRLRRLLPRRRAAAAVRGRAAVSHADVVSDLDRAQRQDNGRPAGAGARPRARPAAGLLARRARPDVDRRRSAARSPTAFTACAEVAR